MNAIIARPATGARPGHARKKAKPADAAPLQPINEAEDLCRQAVSVVSTLVARAAESSNITALPPPELLDEADCLLMEIRDNGAKTRGLVGALQRVYTLLDGAASETPERLSTAVGQAVFAGLTISSALALVKALETSYEAGDLQRLRALGTYQGAMEVAVRGRSAEAPVPVPSAPVQIHESFGQLAALLKQAARTDEAHAHCGDSDRLLRIGGELAARAAASLSADDCEDLAFDIAACVSASSRVPGDTQSPKRAEFIKVAANALALLAGTSIEDILRGGAGPVPENGVQAARDTIRLFALDCSYDVQGLADAVTLLGEEIGSESIDLVRIAALLRCYGTRIRDLNSILMSFIDEDPLSARHMKHTLYRGATTSTQEGL